MNSKTSRKPRMKLENKVSKRQLTGIGPYLKRSDHKLRQTSVSRLRRVTAHRRSSLPIYGMNGVVYIHEFKQGSGHTWSEVTTTEANSSFDFEVGSSTVANT